MIHLRPASLAAFTRDAAQALAAAVVDRATENKRLRAANRDLHWQRRSLTADVDAMAAIISDLAEQLATSRRALAQAVNHPCVRAADFDFDGPEPPEDAEFYEPPTFAQPVSVGEFGDAMAVLDTDDLTAGDLLWAMGEQA